MRNTLEEYIPLFHPVLPYQKVWYSAKEVGSLLGRSDQFVRDACLNRKIFAQYANGRCKRGSEKRHVYQIHRDAILFFLLETANYSPVDFLLRFKALLKNRSRSELIDIHCHISSTLKSFD